MVHNQGNLVSRFLVQFGSLCVVPMEDITEVSARVEPTSVITVVR